MPSYEYKCKSCGEKFELRKSIAKDDDTIICPKCGSKHIGRVYAFFTMNAGDDSCAPSRFT